MAAKASPLRARLQTSLQQNKSLAYSRYVQLATVQADGRPANRTIVFRGFLGESDVLTFVTDRRSRKVAELAANPAGEVCWYFPKSREQYRISGELKVIDADHPDEELLKARQAAWARMSDSGRTQFSWPEPGQPRVDDKAAFSQAAPGPQEPALATFCLVLFQASHVDYIQLFNNKRELLQRDEATSGWRPDWLAVNP